jgi:hypothetical protein
MSREVAFYFHLVLSVGVLLSIRYLYVFIAVKAMRHHQYTILDSFYKQHFHSLKWFLPLYPVFFNVLGWVQVALNQMDILSLLLQSFLVWLVFIVLHIAFRYRLFFYAFVSLLWGVVAYMLLLKKPDFMVLGHLYVIWLFLARFVCFLKKYLYKYKIFSHILIFLGGTWFFFVWLCFVFTRNADYSIFLFLYLFLCWTVFLGYCLFIMWVNPDYLTEQN